jgi:hypothetical protein
MSAGDCKTELRVGSPPQPPPTSTLLNNWGNFREWLIRQGKTKSTVKYTVNYTKRFYTVLDTEDASPLLTLSDRNKQHALTALANYAKFTGRYDKFLQLRQRYNLKWSRGDPMIHFERFFNEGLTLDVMLQRIRKMISLLPPIMGQIVKFGCLVGLRASEVVECVRLLNEQFTYTKTASEQLRYTQASPPYYNPERQALEHFRFPQFLRQTKKAYLSFVTPEMIDMVRYTERSIPTLDAITHDCRRKGIKMEMYLSRKIFASFLRKEGIEPEVIDLLQGRVSQSVLTRHYLTPSQDLKDRVLDALKQLQRQLN